jgi:heterodisulfide reductase subunit A
VTLATAIVPSADVQRLARIYKVSSDADGFFQEAHSKLRPVDFASDGLFLAGVAHYPKPVDEAIAQGLAVVARATSVLSKRIIELDSIRASVTESCDGCALCLGVCPYHALSLEEVSGSTKTHIKVNTVKCKGCGVCQATCPKEGVTVGGFSYRQISAQIEAALR